MAAKLPNYLRSHRLRSGFSQDEIAFLLGAESGAQICRHEQYERMPTLRTIIGYTAIFDISTDELFCGIADAVKVAIKMRAARLVDEVMKTPKTNVRSKKLLVLNRILDAQ